MNDSPILPGATIGLVGAGQLARMFALEARRMGYRTIVLDPDPDAPASEVADAHLVAPLTDLEAARELARRCSVVTLEWENADLAAVRALAELVPVRPGPHVLEIAQDRIREKESARALGLETAPFRAIDSLAGLQAAVAELGVPAVLKTARGGYDGKGQRVIRAASEAAEAFEELGSGEAELILEGWIDFEVEASIICARSPAGEIATFPLVENIHRNGILDFTLAPARLPAAIQVEAEQIARTLVEGLDVVGLLAIELFLTRDGRLLVNELAPRPHNSGHYTWEACDISQFEQQLRAACGLPLAEPLLLSPAAMANLLGEEIGTGEHLATLPAAMRTPSLALHLYGKKEARPGRKMGHLTVLAPSAELACQRVARARELLQIPNLPAT